MKSLNTPLRRLDGITYRGIEDPDGIRDYVNKEIRKEWETDARQEHREPENDPWLRTLSKRKWSLQIIDMKRIKLNPAIMKYVDPQRGYVFSERLEERSRQLQESIRIAGSVIWPLIVRKKDMQLVDGYCRYSTLRAMGMSTTYAYVGTL
jgi:hypothetical protein